MPNSLGTDQSVGKLLNVPRLTAQEYHFKAGIVVEMGVQGRDNDFVVFVLKISELLGKKPSVVVIDQRNCPDDRSFRGHHRSSNKSVPDQVTKSLRPVFVALFRDEPVKAIE